MVVIVIMRFGIVCVTPVVVIVAVVFTVVF